MVKKSKFAAMKKVAILLFGWLCINSCSTDFDVIAPYKEVMVIDGLIDALDSVQSVRIQKAFLGEGNALVMAQQPDSINYADILDVRMERILNKAVLETFPLNRIELSSGAEAKDSGIFASPFHIIYQTNHPILQDGSEYRIRVTNTQTDVEASSQTKIVKDMIVSSPLSGPTAPFDSIDFANTNNLFYVQFTPGENSNIYDLIVRFHFREIDHNGLSSTKFIDWHFADKMEADQADEVLYSFEKTGFFTFIGEKLSDSPGFTRRIDSLPQGVRAIELLLVQGSEELRTYLGLQNPIGLVQERPLYTTVENGLGLFTSRTIHSIYRHPNRATLDSILVNPATSNKNFVFN
jgi:hypothetical protein